MAAGPVLSIGHALRRALLGQGPMKRTCDRVHVLLRVVMLLVLLAAPSVGSAVSTAARERLTATADEWRAVLVQEEAVLLADAEPAGDGTGTGPAPARWPNPSGGQVEASVAVPDTARAGDRVTVWVTATGAAHAAPATPRDIRLRAATTGVVVAIATVLLGVVGYAGGVALLDRVRDRLWTAEWAVVEPRWRTLPGGPSLT